MLSQAETIITIVGHFGRTKQIHKLTTIFAHNDPGGKSCFEAESFSVFEVAQFVKMSHNIDYFLSQTQDPNLSQVCQPIL